MRKTIVIKDKPFLLDSTKLAVFDLPETIKLGEELKVKDRTNNASSWEWRFGETASVNSTQKIAKYVYESAGLKTVSLVVNGDLKHATNKQIRVLKIEKDNEIKVVEPRRTISGKRISKAPVNPAMGDKGKKPADSGAPKTIPNITEGQFKNKLLLIAKKKARADAFKLYFCGDLDKTIIVNGEKISFLQFCELLKIKKFKIKSVNLIKDDNNCIKNVTIIRSKYII